jgi:hypothetical protein
MASRENESPPEMFDWMRVYEDSERSGSPFVIAMAAALPTQHDGINQYIVEDFEDSPREAAFWSAQYADLLADEGMDEIARAHADLALFIGEHRLRESDPSGFARTQYEVAVVYRELRIQPKSHDLSGRALELADTIESLSQYAAMMRRELAREGNFASEAFSFCAEPGPDVPDYVMDLESSSHFDKLSACLATVRMVASNG